MEKYRDLLELDMNEGAETSIEDFISTMEADFKKHFPNGYFGVKYSTNLTDSIGGTFGMIGNIKDNTGGYHENDKMKHGFVMFPLDAEKTIWSFKVSGGAKVYINPAEGSFNAMDSIKTKMGNNSKITLAKANVKMAKFFKKLSGIMKDNKDNIFGVDKINKKYLTFK